MNNVKKNFSIRDLENLSGIKAHTIRIWERRYNLLAPDRTTTNIRTYSLESLQKLLNVTLLYQNGYKISKIAKIPEEEIPVLVQNIATRHNPKSQAINAFKMAMINFDQALFQKTYAKLRSKKSFHIIFWEIFMPLLNDLGLLWQTKTISPAHEHFITHLIKQKLYISTAELQLDPPSKKDKVFVLFLPENEIHEIGLLFLHYEITRKGYKTIYLGQTMPLDNLVDLKKYYSELYFLSYFTVAPTKDKLEKYFWTFTKKLGFDRRMHLWVLGQQTKYVEKGKLQPHIKVFESIKEFTDLL